MEGGKYYSQFLMQFLTHNFTGKKYMYKRTIFNQDGKLQKRAARIILNATTETPSAVMFKRLEWLTIYNRINYFRAVYERLNT